MRALACSVCLLLAVGVAASIAHAQAPAVPEPVIRVEGRVLWVTGLSLLLGFPDKPPVPVDLHRIAMSEVRDLAPNDWIVVTGVVLRPGHQVLALSIAKVSPWSPAPPP